MLKFFFNRKSWAVKTALVSALVWTALIFITRTHWAPWQIWGWGFFLAQAAFAKALEVYPWYPAGAKGPGIRLHFQKVAVPVAYLWFLVAASDHLAPSPVWLLAANALHLPMTAVSGILLYFHLSDPDPSRPNELSGSNP